MTSPPLADAAPSSTTAADGRPDFLVRLGILLPCSVADVEAAYRDRAKQAHPDAGGTTADFIQLHADYEAALQYARFRSSRRAWLAATIERYAAQQDVVAEIERRGGSVETERNEWIARQIGDDFAQVLDTVVGVRLTGQTVGLADVQFLASKQHSLAGLKRLDLSASQVGNTAVQFLIRFSTLHELDLSGTLVGNACVSTLRRMDALRRVNLAHTFVGWWGLIQLHRRRPDLQVATCCEKGHSAEATKCSYRWALTVLVLYVVAVLIATHAPIEPELSELGPWVSFDKLAHIGIYGVLSCLAAFVIALTKLRAHIAHGSLGAAVSGNRHRDRVVCCGGRDDAAAHRSTTRFQRLGRRPGGDWNRTCALFGRSDLSASRTRLGPPFGAAGRV